MTTLAPTSVAATASPTTTATTPPPTTAAPTTAAPTTLATSIAPTSVAATATPTTILTTLAPTTPLPVTRDPALDITFNCKANNSAGALIVTFTMAGLSQGATYVLDADELAVVITISGEVPSAVRVDSDGLAIVTSISGWGVANDQKKNWVGWSKIGEANFILDKVNDAGFRPMAWDGYIYQVKKLDKNVVIYGSGGVTLAYPVAEPYPSFGFKDLHFVGVKNKTAVGGNEFIHFFIDDTGALYKVTTEGLEYMGFEEFLLPLTYPVLLYDEADKRLYISDAATGGYVLREDVLTGGYEGLSGLYRIKNVLTAIGPDTIEVDPVYIVTDIMDFKRRGMKHIEEIQFGVSSDMPLYSAVDFRFKKSESFRTTRWVRLNDEGVAKIPCSGVEFRIRLKAEVLGTFDISYIKVQHKYIDQRFTRDPRGNPIDAY